MDKETLLKQLVQTLPVQIAAAKRQRDINPEILAALERAHTLAQQELAALSDAG